MNSTNPTKRRPNRRRVLVAIAAAGAIAVAVLLRCESGLGLGTGNDAPDNARSADTVAATQGVSGSKPATSRCQLRLDAKGLSLSDQAITMAQAVAACQRAGEADLVVTGAARYGALEQLEAALNQAGVRVYKR